MIEEIKIEGISDIERAFKTLSGEMRQKIAQEAVAAAAPILVHKISENANSMVGGEMGGLIAQSATAVKMRNMSDAVGMKVQLKPDDRFIHVTKSGNRYFIPFAIEYGHYIARRGQGKMQYVGSYGKLARSIERAGGQKTSPVPYMRKAADEVETEVQSVITEVIENGIERLMKESNQGLAG